MKLTMNWGILGLLVTSTRGFTMGRTSHLQQHSFSSSSQLEASKNNYDQVCDILVLGSGPAARAIASLLGSDFKTVLADQNFDRAWPPNYGVWQDEWEAVATRYEKAGVPFEGGNDGQCVDHTWKVTDCYFGGSYDIPIEERLRVDRPYFRVDKKALQESLTTGKYAVLKANHISEATGTNVYKPAGSLVHDDEGTTIQLATKDDQIMTIRTQLVVDCTGHESKLVLKETRPESTKPGFQIAYGFLVDVDETDSPDLSRIGPYDKEAMTLFDYRTDHFEESEVAKVSKAPTFMYVMPLKNNQVFFEETSLVARPGVSFQECKDRCFKRLKHLGIKTTKLYEEEFCYIPMGGALPAKEQRVLALGGSAAMVHPSTGYHICRCLMGATDMAEAIRRELNEAEVNLDRAAASAYHSIWTPENQRQRHFTVFGGEFLMKQNVVGLRGFFDGFFRLPLPLWAGFLAGWPGLPNNDQHESWLKRMIYGVNFLARLRFSVAADMVASIVVYMITEGPPLVQSVTPLLGEPESYEYKRNMDRVGDVAAKEEARRMLQESAVTEDIPVSFDPLKDSTEARVKEDAFQ